MVHGCAQWSAALTQPAPAATYMPNQHARARARTHLKLLSDTASLPVLQPDTLAGLPWGGVLLPRGCFVVVNEGCGRNTASRAVPKPR